MFRAAQILVTLCAALATGAAQADDGKFTSADVLAWDEDGQNSFFQTSISMVRIVAIQTGDHDEIVACINDWYAGPKQAERHSYIRSKLEAFDAYHPQGIIMAVLEEACGGFAG